MKAPGLAAGLCAATAAIGLTAFVAATWQPAIPALTERPGFDHAMIVKGAELAAIGDCAVCHIGRNGQAYAGGVPLHTPFGQIYASNITPDPQTGIGGWSESAFARAMRNGVDRAGTRLYPAFPYNHFTKVTDQDIAALYAFLMTRAPANAPAPKTHLPFPLNIRTVMVFWNTLFLDHTKLQDVAAQSAAWNRGRYLVEGLGHCQACHTPHNILGAERASKAFSGGFADGWEGPGLTAASSPAAIGWDADMITHFLKNGFDEKHAAAAGPMGPVSHDLSSVPLPEVQAMSAYIASMIGAPDPARRQKAEALVANAQGATAALAGAQGAGVFNGACAGCHGAGAPMMLMGRPSLALGSAVTAASPIDAAQIILFGLQPAAGEHGPWMPGFSASLDDRQVAAVMAYVRARFSDQPAWRGLPATIGQIRQDHAS